MADQNQSRHADDEDDIPAFTDLTQEAQEAGLAQKSKTQPRRNAVIQHWRDYYRTYIDSFARYGVLSRDMLAVLSGHTPTTVRNALHGMAREGFVQYHRTQGQVLYYLSKAGLALSEYQQVARSSKEAFGLARHDLVINTLLCNTILNSNPPEYGLVRWLGPLEAKEELTQYYGFEQTERSKRLNYLPDAYFEYCAVGEQGKVGLYPVILEVDLGTETTSRVLRKLEAGIRTLAQKPNAKQFNLLWFFVSNDARFARVADAMHDRFLELKKELPMGRVPQVLLKFAEQDAWQNLHFPIKCPELETAELTNFTGYGAGEVYLKDFVGVSFVQDRVRKKKVLRTQIPSLGNR